MKDSCQMCVRNNVKTFKFGSCIVCQDCVSIANRLINENVTNSKPHRKNSDALISLVFFLELDLLITRGSLISCNNYSALQPILMEKMEKLRLLDTYGVRGDGSQDRVINDIVSQHKTLLSLYID